jgi:hypothetical protein
MSKTFATVTSEKVVVKRSSESHNYAYVVVRMDGGEPEFASSLELATKKYNARHIKGRVELLPVYEVLKNLKGRLVCKHETGYLVIEPDGSTEVYATTAPLTEFINGIREVYK